MNTCLIHSQSYPQEGFCVYCGPPKTADATRLTAGRQCQCIGSGGVNGVCIWCGGWIAPFGLPSVTLTPESSAVSGHWWIDNDGEYHQFEPIQ